MTIHPLLLLHVGSGAVGLISGTVAICYRKGLRVHRISGDVFTWAMISLGASGAVLGLLKSQWGNVVGGVLTVYMVSTAYNTARRRLPRVTTSDWIFMLAGLVASVSILALGVMVARTPTGSLNGVPASMNFFMGGVLLLAVIGDMRVMARGGITGVARIARHLWRMCFALFIASGSFFLGRAAIFPRIVQRSGLLEFLSALPLLLLVFWLVRVRFKHVFARMQIEPAPIVLPAIVPRSTQSS